jgi:hypothetical protein
LIIGIAGAMFSTVGSAVVAVALIGV